MYSNFSPKENSTGKLGDTIPELFNASPHSFAHLILEPGKYFDSGFIAEATVTPRVLGAWLGLPNWERARLIPRSQHDASSPSKTYKDVNPAEMGWYV